MMKLIYSSETLFCEVGILFGDCPVGQFLASPQRSQLPVHCLSAHATAPSAASFSSGWRILRIRQLQHELLGQVTTARKALWIKTSILRSAELATAPSSIRACGPCASATRLPGPLASRQRSSLLPGFHVHPGVWPLPLLSWAWIEGSGMRSSVLCAGKGWVWPSVADRFVCKHISGSSSSQHMPQSQQTQLKRHWGHLFECLVCIWLHSEVT